MLQTVECPRDAMQGYHKMISTADKVRYLNTLLKVGFHTLDFGSFVSPKAIPQLADTAEVLAQLDWQDSPTRLLAIVANKRGAEEALSHEGVRYLGYPFSVSETFQVRNTNKTIAESLVLVQEMQELCTKGGKELVVYLSMGFGNPYGDAWSEEIVGGWAAKMADMGIGILSLADTVGTADNDTIRRLFSHLIAAYPHISFGAHFHALPQESLAKIAAAYESGCRRFDSAMKGIGGCPFAKDYLVGNIATEKLVEFAAGAGIDLGLDLDKYSEALLMAGEVF